MFGLCLPCVRACVHSDLNAVTGLTLDTAGVRDYPGTITAGLTPFKCVFPHGSPQFAVVVPQLARKSTVRVRVPMTPNQALVRAEVALPCGAFRQYWSLVPLPAWTI
jgi:hypothetical protein